MWPFLFETNVKTRYALCLQRMWIILATNKNNIIHIRGTIIHIIHIRFPLKGPLAAQIKIQLRKIRFPQKNKIIRFSQKTRKIRFAVRLNLFRRADDVVSWGHSYCFAEQFILFCGAVHGFFAYLPIVKQLFACRQMNVWLRANVPMEH